MQEFEHTSRDDYAYTEQELSCPYFDDSDYYASLLIDWSVTEDQNN